MMHHMEMRDVVEEEAAKAKQAGFPVELVHFGKSGHVAHARENPDKYWDAVRSFWSESVKQQSD